MAHTQLIHRLAGISAICLAAVLVPVSPEQRVLLLTAFGLGIGMASVRPAYDRAAARLVGPAVLVLALVPLNGLWGIVALGAVGVVGFACFDLAGMSRAVPALGLPIMTLMFRSGDGVSRSLLLAWVAVLIITIMVGTRAGLGDRGPVLAPVGGATDRPAVNIGRRRLLHAAGVIAVVVPLSILVAGRLDRLLPDQVGPPPRAGDRTVAAQVAHPGLRGGLDAGSPVVLSDDVVLRVRADRPLYWRGTTYADWDGRRWTSDVELSQVSWSGDGVVIGDAVGRAESLPPLGVDLPRPVTVAQQFTAAQAGLDVLLGAWRIETLQTSERRAHLGDDGSLAMIEPLGAGARWTVQSTLVPADADDLRRADPALLPADHPLLVRYGHETDIAPAVAELARAITADAPTSYDKVIALEAWMDDNIRYTRDIQPLPHGADAVDHLLFESRRGFCEQIGSAMVVMLRSLGVPSRLVVGYVPGDYDSTSGEWLSRGTDAHAWAEVYFPGVGWQGFDPTAGVPLVAAEASGPILSDRSLAWLGGSVLIGLVAVAALRRRGPDADVDTAPDVVVHLQGRLDRCGRVLGRSWPEAMTIREKGDDLVLVGLDREIVAELVRRFEQLLFFTIDRREPHDHEADGLATALARLEHEVAGAVACATAVGAGQGAGRAGQALRSGSRAWERST